MIRFIIMLVLGLLGVNVLECHLCHFCLILVQFKKLNPLQFIQDKVDVHIVSSVLVAEAFPQKIMHR